MLIRTRFLRPKPEKKSVHSGWPILTRVFQIPRGWDKSVPNFWHKGCVSYSSSNLSIIALSCWIAWTCVCKSSLCLRNSSIGAWNVWRPHCLTWMLGPQSSLLFLDVWPKNYIYCVPDYAVKKVSCKILEVETLLATYYDQGLVCFSFWWKKWWYRWCVLRAFSLQEFSFLNHLGHALRCTSLYPCITFLLTSNSLCYHYFLAF
jgi:hypothetical protein